MSIWKNKNFNYLYFGQLFSVFGDWIKTVTLITFIYYLTGDAKMTGVLFILAILPQIVVSFFSGPIIDKNNKKKLIIFLDIVRFLLGIVLVYAAYIESLGLLLSVIFITNIFSAIFVPTRSSFIPQIIKKEQIVSATSAILISFNVMMVVATAMGGILSEWLGVIPILIIAAGTYLIAGLCILPITYEHKKDSDSERDSSSYWNDLKVGYEATISSPQLRSTFILNGTRDFVLGAVNVMFNAIILSTFLAGETGIGFGYTATALAYIVVGFYVKKQIKVKTMENVRLFSKMSLFLTIAYGILLAVGFSTNSLYLFLIFVFLMNIPQGTMNILFESSVMYNAKDDQKGRIFSLLITFTRLGYLFGLLFYMALGDYLSLISVGWILCLLLSVVGLTNYMVYRTHGHSVTNEKQIVS
ncbi:MFS transporter [Salipaludibacillus agaradhaerens]|uniref:MFS transporter n=1 Tax=Salipaludibacillus agaradhaerens TaxID=76935 RepID=UPI000997A175|nr:MFS transporter [Salipaludibacillus agaradhaerens]